MHLIEIPSWWNTTLIEAVWMLCGVLAVGICLFHIRPLYKDWRAAVATERPILVTVAVAYLRREIVRILQGVCITVIGLYASITPPLVPGPARVSYTGLVLTIVLLFVAVLISVQSALDWRTREHIVNYIEAHSESESP